ncbi:MAG: hypothetical protein ACO1OT_17555 [Heyndrickxia sp.]
MILPSKIALPFLPDVTLSQNLDGEFVCRLLLALDKERMGE